MPTMCIQCSMLALVEGREPPIFDETPDEHQRRVHPDLIATQRERRDLERRLRDQIRQHDTPKS